MARHANSVTAECRTQNAQDIYAKHAVIQQGLRTTNVEPAVNSVRFAQERFVRK